MAYFSFEFGLGKKCGNSKNSKDCKSGEVIKGSRQEKFSKAVIKCHAKTKTKDSFGECMSKRLKK